MKKDIGIKGYLGLAFILVLAFVINSCDRTIHEYPKGLVANVVIQANIDHIGPYDFKMVILGNDATSITELDKTALSEKYEPEHAWQLRVTYEIYTRRENNRADRLVERRVKFVNKTDDRTVDTIHTRLVDDKYIVGIFADYVSTKNKPYSVENLNNIELNYEQPIVNPYMKTANAGRKIFNIDFNLNEYGYAGMTEEQMQEYHRQGISAFIPVEMPHITARYRIITTDYDLYQKTSGTDEEEIVTVVRYVNFVSVGFNAMTDEPNKTSKGYETAPQDIFSRGVMNQSSGTVLSNEDNMSNKDNSANHESLANNKSSANEKTLFMDYVLTSPNIEKEVWVDIIFKTKSGQLINEIKNVKIPLLRNHETIVKGMFLTKEFKNDNGMCIDEGFEGELGPIIISR